MEVKIKILKPEAKVPEFAHHNDAGADLYAIEDSVIQPGQRQQIFLGFATEFPDDYVALVWDKGGPAANAGITTIAGVIDAGYRGEWIVVLLNTSEEMFEIKKGQKIAQVLFQKVEQPTFIKSDLSDSERGEGRQGSTGIY